jgi:hypothetical protein
MPKLSGFAAMNPPIKWECVLYPGRWFFYPEHAVPDRHCPTGLKPGHLRADVIQGVQKPPFLQESRYGFQRNKVWRGYFMRQEPIIVT